MAHGRPTGPGRIGPRFSLKKHLACVLVAVLASVTSDVPPAAAGERELVVTPALGYAAVRTSGRTAHGGTVHLDVDYGLTDSWSLRASGRYLLASDPVVEPQPLQLAGLSVGALFIIDVLKVVPYAGVTVGASWIHGAEKEHRFNADLGALVGADWLISRQFSVGIELRYALQVPDISRFPWMLSALIRLSWRKP